MLKFLKALVLLPIAILVVLLAVANRHPVVLSFDPLSPAAPEISLTVPLYAIMFACVGIGVLVGGIGAWLAQAPKRREQRLSRREVRRLRAETERLRSDVPALSPPSRI